VRYLVEAWPAIRAKHPDATLLILGQGPEEANLKAKTSDGVIFGGAVHNVPPYLQAADVFVLPSIAEGFSVAMLEAMASELAVVITDVGGARDAIDDTVHGLVIPPDDQPALEQALLAVLGDQASRQRMGQAARQRVQQEFALSVIAKQLRGLYENIATLRT